MESHSICPFVTDLFTEHNVPRVHPCCSLRQDFLLFQGWMVFCDMYEVCPEGAQPGNMKNRDIYWRRYQIQETLYIGQWHLSPLQSSTLGPHTVLPFAISSPIVFSWILSMVWNLFLFKGDFSFGKRQKLQGVKSGLSGAESPGWFDVFCWKTLHEMWCVSGHVVVMKLPVTSCPQLRPLNLPKSFRGGMFKLNTKFNAHSLFYWLSRFECNNHTIHMSLNGIYRPHWLVQ